MPAVATLRLTTDLTPEPPNHDTGTSPSFALARVLLHVRQVLNPVPHRTAR
jgi:hypothetical protein